jgi:PAS domain S-box-containing protein
MHRLREQAKIKQQQLIAEYETLLQQAPIGIYLVDSDFRLRQVNPVAQPVFGNIPGLIGRDFDEVIHILWTKDYADELVRIFRHTLDTGEPYATNERAEKRLDRGVTEYYEWRVDRIPLPDGTHGVVCYFRDISVQVKARTALAQSEKLYRELAETLERQVRERTFELESQNVALEKQSEEVRNLSARLLQSQDEERRRVARELHDSAGQTLAALAMEHAHIAASLKVHAPELVKELDPVEKLVRLLVQEIRTTSYLLHPPLLDELGLAGALRWYVEGLVERSGLNIQLELAEDFGRLSSEMELTVFRIVQEALTNVHRHSGSKEASIRIARDNSHVVVEIRDKGRGISPERLKQAQSQGLGVGLRGMRERVHQLHGIIKINSDHSGTAIHATFPIAEQVEPSPEVISIPSAPSA